MVLFGVSTKFYGNSRMFPFGVPCVTTLVLLGLFDTASTNRTRSERHLRQYIGNPSPPPPEYFQISDFPRETEGNVQPAIYYPSLAGSSSASASASNNGFKPGPPVEYSEYRPVYSPPSSSQLTSSYPENKPDLSSFYSANPSFYYPSTNHFEPHKYSSTGAGNTLGYLPHLSPYHQSYSPAISNYEPSPGYLPGKPPSQAYNPSHSHHHHHHDHHPPHFHHYHPHYHHYGSSASASASAGFGSSASAVASASSPGSNYGWAPPPVQQPTPSTPSPSVPPSPSSQPEASNHVFGWGPPPHSQQQMRPPYKPVPEFSYQFSLKPSSFGWETSYNVPCGNYKIQPRVVAHLRLATQAVLPPGSGGKSSAPGNSKRRKRSSIASYPAQSFLDPFRLERQLQSFTPYQKDQAFAQSRPTFRPRTCRWNFNAVDGCKLNFKCSWFQLPALFRCEENLLHLTDSTVLLDKTFCGNRRPRSEELFSSSSGRLTATFKSRGAALPAILDCTVICGSIDDGLITELNTPAPAESSTSSSYITLNQSSGSSFPIIAISSGPTHKEQQHQRANTTVNKPSKPQLRMGNCKCGVPDSNYTFKAVHGRIVGGTSMAPGESPWTAALVKRNSNRPYCGASLINDRFLLTAAHCVLSQSRRSGSDTASGTPNKTNVFSRDRIHFDVLLNEHDISQANEIAGGAIRAKVDQVIVHPLYDNVTYHFDAALIRLAEPIQFSSNWKVPQAEIYELSNSTGSLEISSGNVKRHQKENSTHMLFHNVFDFHSLKRKKRFLIPEIEAREIPPKPVPICLPEKSDRIGRDEKFLEDAYAVVTGWGLMAEGGTPSNEMLKARVQIFNDSTCHELYKKHNYVITGSMMCAGYINGRIDSCVGDSGSPLATEDKDRFVLTGVVSWGRGCGRKQLPGVYTRVTELTDWIYSEASTNDAVWCE